MRSRDAVIVVIGIGLALRAVVVGTAPRYGFTADHSQLIGWGLLAESRGVLHVYYVPPRALPLVYGYEPREQGFVVSAFRPHAPNYPPLALLVLRGETAVLRALQGEPILANTVTARLVMALAQTVAEAVTALGVAAIVAAAGGSMAAARAGGVATWLAPPLMLNSIWWSQQDTLVLAPIVLVCWALLRARWAIAGACTGVALLVKPQALLLFPIILFASSVPSLGVPTATAALRRLGTIVGTALAVVILVSAPWLVTHGLDWVRRCYPTGVGALGSRTSLLAYNAWYLLELIGDRLGWRDVTRVDHVVVGFTLDAWGRALFLIALAASAIVAARTFRSRPAVGLVVFAALSTWSAFMWPTRVHERYVLYCVPFVIAAAALLPNLRGVAVALIAVATLEHTWTAWRSAPPVGDLIDAAAAATATRAMVAEWLTTLLSLGAYALAFRRVVENRPPPSPARP